MSDFRERLRQQAEAVRQGGVNVHTFADFWDVASQLSFDQGAGGVYLGPDAQPLTGYDAEDAHLLWAFRSREAWQVDEDNAQDIDLVRRSFAGLADELDPRIPVEIAPGEERQMVVSEVAAVRTWLGEKLGIKNPSGFLLDELAQKAAARLELGAAINAGLFDDLFKVSPAQETEQAVGGVTVTLSDTEPDNGQAPAADLNSEYVVITRPMLADPIGQGSGGWREVEVLPPRPEGHVIRSHRRKNHYFTRVRRLAAVAALAIGVWMVGTSGPTEHAAEPEPMVIFHDPPPVIGEPATAELPPTHKPPALETPPETPADHVVPLGEYDPAARTGAIWFAVEDYAAQLGHPSLTLLQTHLLTDKCIQYMDAKLPGGMSWDQAMYLPSGIQLPYPPAGTMEGWIKEVLAQTGTVV